MSATTISSPLPIESNPDSLELKPVLDLAKAPALLAIDTGARVADALEGAIATTAWAVSKTVPATVHFVGSFLLPEAANQIVTGGVEFATKVTTWAARGAANAALQAVTFGVPAWSQALRQGLAVSGATGSLDQSDNSRDFLARCFVESSESSLIKESLLQYLDLRKELNTLRVAGGEESADISALAKQIASLEVSLREYQDFRDLKLILDKGPEFVEQQQKRINDLALETADKILARVTNYYKDKCGFLAGTVSSSWDSQGTKELQEQKREELRDRIAGRLQKVFMAELTSEETAAEIAEVTRELHSAFGTYRASFKAAMATALGCLYAGGALEAALEKAWSTCGSLVGGGISYVVDTAQATLNGLCDWAVDGVNGALQSVSDVFVQGVKDAASSISNGISSGIDYTLNAVDSLTGPTFNGSYSLGSNQVMVGLDAAGQPIFGESCISGLPPTPRIDSVMDLGNLFESAPPVTELLEGSTNLDAGALDAEALEALGKWVSDPAHR